VPDVLDRLTEPVGQALLWLRDEDDFLPECEVSGIPQRDVTALLYFSTAGTDWTENGGWLTSTHECTWFGTSCDEDGTTIEMIILGKNY